jgi:uncharacterized protein YciI
MLCVVHRIDNPANTYLRKVHRDIHLVHLEKYRSKILLAGPYLDPATGVDRGSMFLMEVANLQEAKDFAEKDPYMEKGVFQHLEVWQWTKKTGSLELKE